MFNKYINLSVSPHQTFYLDSRRKVIYNNKYYLFSELSDEKHYTREIRVKCERVTRRICESSEKESQEPLFLACNPLYW